MSLQAFLDFGEDEGFSDKKFWVAEKILKNIFIVKRDIYRIVYRSKVSKGVYEGEPMVIVGNVNAGKSTVMNFLGGKEVSIVTDVRGTTRDVVGFGVEIGGKRVL